MKAIHKESLHRAPNATGHELKDNTKEQEPASLVQVIQRRMNLVTGNMVKEMAVNS